MTSAELSLGPLQEISRFPLSRMRMKLWAQDVKWKMKKANGLGRETQASSSLRQVADAECQMAADSSGGGGFCSLHLCALLPS